MARSEAMPVQPVDLPANFDLLQLHAGNPERYPYLLESVAMDSHRRDEDAFDILFAFPGEMLRLDDQFQLHGPGAGSGHQFLPALDDWWRRTRRPPDAESPVPFRGGWFVFLGYELVRQIEHSIRTQHPPAGPVAFATRIPVALVRNRRNGQAWIVAEPAHRGDAALLEQDIRASRLQEHVAAAHEALVTGISEPDPATYLRAVEKTRHLIARGDVYQVNLARRWTATVSTGLGAADIYRRLRRTNPAPYAGVATLGDWSVISSSPERLVRSRDGTVDTRPIAGTRPTADDPGLEEARRQDLLANPKERAEHIMLIDLERNDLGRVCQPGTVEVDEFMAVESYAHVHHIVSNIRGRLRDDVSPGDLIRAMFPGGTITGCPKVRCMEIISDLEGAPRGAYTGSMGYLNQDGSCDLNILIRSFTLHGRDLSFAAGSGIVADSSPVRELEETRAKAKGLLLALAG
jgi:anthranilate synthase component 1